MGGITRAGVGDSAKGNSVVVKTGGVANGNVNKFSFSGGMSSDNILTMQFISTVDVYLKNIEETGTGNGFLLKANTVLTVDAPWEPYIANASGGAASIMIIATINEN